ncbi:endocuticle structural glycoprotein SgAbd-1-like [Maniola hyperantus]|uniref:endocuticle structural glycoprotein SgAbd-1-like n=1 Tax=Aphantopus hyperantus TaxID=2795564 RepID=UPI00374987CF
MKFLVILAVAVACAAADVSHIVRSDDDSAPIVRSGYELSPEGTFQYYYETGNGISAQADGVMKRLNSVDEPALEVTGSFRYISPEGTPVETTYVAGEQGYVASGSHIPVPPPIPELILRGLAYTEAHRPATDEKVYKQFLVVLAVAVACAAADVSHIVKSDDYLVPIVRSTYDINPEGNSYNYAYETGNGISASAEGSTKLVDNEPAVVVRGGFRYTAPDGTPIETTYTADENGYQPQGSHIPVGPPIPEAIARSLAYIAANYKAPEYAAERVAERVYRP